MRILLASVVNRRSEIETRYPPLWPAYLAAFVDKYLDGVDVEFHYAGGDWKNRLTAFRPDLFAIGSVSQNYASGREYARAAQAMGIPVVVGGMHISALPGSLYPEADVGVIGEGERTFLELVRSFIEFGRFDKKALHDIEGLVFRDGGELIRTADRLPIADLDSIPHPKRSLIGYPRRNYLITARGCPYKCVFCICARYWGPVRYASADYVLDEIDELVANGAKVIRFNDDNFAANGKRLAEIAERVCRRGHHRKVKFSCWSRANNITPQTVELLKAMNVVSVVMGLESGSDRTLEYLKGNVTVEQNRKAVAILKKAGIQANADFMIGAPQETAEEMMETYRFIQENPVDFVTINVFSPLPGTPVWEEAVRRNLVSDDMDWSWLNFKFNPDTSTCVHLSETMDHRQFMEIYRKFQRLKSWRNLIAIPRSPWLNELPGVIVRRANEKLFRKRSPQ